MRIKFRWENYRGFENTGWIEQKPLTIFIGANGSGKSSLFQPLLMLGQTLISGDKTLCLMTNGEYLNLGSYKDVIYNHNLKNNLKLSFEILNSKQMPGKGSENRFPAIFELEFCYPSKSIRPKLKTFSIRDAQQKPLLIRQLNANGKYSIEFYLDKLSPKNNNEKRIYKHITQQNLRYFYFDDSEIVRKEFAYAFKHDKVKEGLKIPKKYLEYLKIISLAEAIFKTYLFSIKYLGPLREVPHRYYDFRGKHYEEVGRKGEFTYSALLKLQMSKTKVDKDNAKAINEWMRRFGLVSEIKTDLIRKSGLVEINVKTLNKKLKLNLADTGFGVSQLLPLIAQAIIADKNDLIITEQPEIHLNPKLENCLADFCVEMVRKGKQFLIETHSEHLLLRVRTLLKSRMISPNQIGLYYNETINGKNCIREISVNENGEFPNNDWPKGFFGETLKESLNLASLKEI